MKTKILFTFGPSCSSPRMLNKLAALAHGIRINTAHGTVREHAKTIALIRKCCDLPIVLDIKGPELRAHIQTPLKLSPNSVFTLSFSGPNSFSHDFSREAKKGDKILFEDGKLTAQIVGFGKGCARMRALNSHTLEGDKSAHIPKRKLAIPPLSQKDLEEIALANRSGVEYIALSFTRTIHDISHLRTKLNPETGIIAKIENSQGLENIDSIISSSDGVMVARGDLALDIGQEKVPLAQKAIIRKCNNAGKLSITATQVLETMIVNPYPTRAEISDIANAILDGSDCVMLSGETAIGKYPDKAVSTIRSVAKEVESSVRSNVNMASYESVSDAISKSIFTMAGIMPLDSIVSITRSGYTAKMLSRFRMKDRLIALTPFPKVKRQLSLYFGVEPVLIKEIPSAHIIRTAARHLLSKGLMKKSDTSLFTAGILTRQKHASNLIEIHKIGELLTV
ncbi:MAG: pyruvate kinase [Candidatus ainarchaeum sp.]|nr:pyruvate kinase [Candidatus ainarchaeum sp.]